MRGLYLLFSTALLCLCLSCKVEPEQINYGSDACHFCKMTIVDQQHSAQYVTNKGKQFKYDAIECLVNELSEKDMSEIGIMLVADYSDPGKMVMATEATYLISKEIKSPMGANLSGFFKKADAEGAKAENGGQLYNWEALLQKFEVN